ncbi:MAG: hypothetical protein M1822_008249 [Bathelium mastoideum]|nr:MAG: hypothetical protein M1822_008249 [Bathelium mastoideum]
MSGIHGVEHMRHIVGDPEASYDVKRTDLPSPGADCALQNVSISCGKIITGGASFAIGNKDKPIQLTKGGYVPKLEWIHEKFFVFWDERAKRGWLVNGSSALLHLLRAALKRKENGPFRSLLLYKAGSISEAAERRTTESAIRVLTNEDNLRLKIYRDKTEFDQKTVRKGAGEPELISEEKESFFYMQDLVEDIYNVLEKMITHQADVASKNGLSLKCRLRKHIDGWSFNDIIENRDCKPGVVTLQSMGKGWVDLLDDLGAITLYGEDFGELIRPTDTERHCARWSLMPSGNYFLAACMSDIVSIIAAHGNSATEPMKVTSNLAWQNWEKRFELCKCGTTGQLRHSNLAQRLQSSNNKYPARSKSGPLKLHGAIVFSHNTELTLLRGEDTVSSSQKTLGPLDMPKPVTRDSGLGSSRDQSSREDNIEDSSSSSQLHTEARYQGAESTTPGGSVLHNSSPSQGLSNAYSPSEPISGGFAGSEKPWERIKSRLPRFKRSFLKQS